jgi:hypothetical protein
VSFEYTHIKIILIKCSETGFHRVRVRSRPHSQTLLAGLSTQSLRGSKQGSPYRDPHLRVQIGISSLVAGIELI